MQKFCDSKDLIYDNNINANKKVNIDHTKNISNKNFENINIMYTNAWSIRNKINELNCILMIKNIDIIAITETHLKIGKKDLVGEYEIPNFKFYYKDRKGAMKGGGVAVWVKNGLNPELVDIDYNNLQSDILTISISSSAKNSKNKLKFTVVYRPPKQNLAEDELMYNTLNQLFMNNNRLYHNIIVGDFNYPNYLKATNDAESTKFLDFVDDNFLFQKVNNPTRGDNILDLVLTSNNNIIQNLDIGDQLGASDHKIINFNIKFKFEIKNNLKLVPNFRKANFEGFRANLENLNWDKIFFGANANTMYTKFLETIKSLEKQCVPFKSKRENITQKKNRPWFNEDIKLAINNRENAGKRGENQNFIEFRRKVQKTKRRAIFDFEHNLSKEAKLFPKKLHNYISNRNPARGTISEMKIDNVKVNDNKLIATKFNEYFVSVFNKSNILQENDILSIEQTKYTNNIIQTVDFSCEDIDRYITKLNTHKTSGSDEMYATTLKEIKIFTLDPLQKIFTSSMNSGLVPDDFKIANISPIHKSGSKQEISNYRPISLTSIPGKIQESIIRDKIYEYLIQNNLINDTQHGFMKNKSATTNLLQFYDKIFQDYEEGRAVDIIFLDFKKAFDKVPHKKLLKKLRKYGISGDLLNWIQNWLTKRKQRVVINGEESEYLYVTSGVPQGSVLGPLLFLIFIDDLDETVKNSILSKFADDSKVGGAANKLKTCEDRQIELDDMYGWGSENEMEFNINKCKVIHAGSANVNFQYKMNGVNLESVDSYKDLGIYISNNLKVEKQCKEAYKKANMQLGFISRNFQFKSKDIILPLYKSIVRPHLEYAVQAWSPYYQKDIDLLERIQHRATKLIPNLRQKSYEERLESLGLTTLKTRRLRGQLIQAFKIIKQFDKVNPNYFFKFDENSRTRGNELKLKYKTGIYVTDIGKNFFSNSIVKDWNSLPNTVINSTSINMFKNRIDKHFKNVNIK